MAYDATKMADWQISEAAEKKMPTPEEWQQKLGLQKDEIIPYGPPGQARLHQDHEPAEGQAGRQVHRGDRHHPDAARRGQDAPPPWA